MEKMIIPKELQEKLESCGKDFNAVHAAANDVARSLTGKGLTFYQAEVALDYAKVLLKQAKIGS